MTMTPVVAGEMAQRINDENLLARLSHQSVVKNFDPYLDIAWDDPEMKVDPLDERWILPGYEPLGATAWYQALPADRQAGIGFGFGLEDGDPDFRYSYHEVADQSSCWLAGFRRCSSCSSSGAKIPSTGCSARPHGRGSCRRSWPASSRSIPPKKHGTCRSRGTT